VTPSGIEPATFRLVAQRPNYCAVCYRGPRVCWCYVLNYQIINNNGFEVNLTEVTLYRKRNKYLRLKFLGRSGAYFRELNRNCLETCLIPTRESVLADTSLYNGLVQYILRVLLARD